MQKKDKNSRPQSVEEQMANAVRDANSQRVRELKRANKLSRMKKFAWLSDVPHWIHVIVRIAIIILIVLILDGIRRESAEFSASFISASGTVQVLKESASYPELATLKTVLQDGDIITTSDNSSATVLFPDGSAVQIEPNTQFVVRLLDFFRGSVRDRSFMVNYGSITARISSLFGVQSRAAVCTPTSVAAARGTGFQVKYDPQNRQTRLTVYDGVVSYQNGFNVVDASGGTLVDSTYYSTSKPQTVTRSDMSYIGGKINSLSIYETTYSPLQETEYNLNAFLDPILQLMGFGPGGW